MSIINDALKKTQQKLTGGGKKKAEEKKTEPAKTEDKTTNVYEKLYKDRMEKTNEAGAPMSKRAASTSKTGFELPKSIGDWFKTLLAFIFLLGSLYASLLYLSRYKPVEDFLKAAKRKSQSSQFRLIQHAPKKRVYKSGEIILNGTSFIDGKYIALINGEIYEAGDTVDGKEIIAVRDTEVELQDETTVYTIKVY